MVPDVSLGTVFAGVTPFMVAMLVLILILLFIPNIALFLPTLMF
jgi:TRAP-type C4-dicarboxylate transport system permease large subunit